MSQPNLIRGIYEKVVGNANQRQVVLPAAANVTLTANAAGVTYGNWADVALLATVLVPTEIVGISVANPSATDTFTIDIGITLVNGVAYANAAAVIAAGAAVIAAAHRAEVRCDFHQVTAVGVTSYGILPCAPIVVPAGVGIIARCYGVTAAAVTIDVAAVCRQ